MTNRVVESEKLEIIPSNKKRHAYIDRKKLRELKGKRDPQINSRVFGGLRDRKTIIISNGKTIIISRGN